MKNSYILSAIIAVALTTYSCSKKDNDTICPSCLEEGNRLLKNDPGELDDPVIIIRFSGMVVDAGENPISEATIELGGHELYGHNTQSNVDGYFAIDLVEAVAYQLTFSAAGYQSKYYDVDFDTISSDTIYWGIETLQEE